MYVYCNTASRAADELESRLTQLCVCGGGVSLSVFDNYFSALVHTAVYLLRNQRPLVAPMYAGNNSATLLHTKVGTAFLSRRKRATSLSFVGTHSVSSLCPSLSLSLSLFLLDSGVTHIFYVPETLKFIRQAM